MLEWLSSHFPPALLELFVTSFWETLAMVGISGAVGIGWRCRRATATAPFRMLERVGRIVVARLPVLCDGGAGELRIHGMGGMRGTAVDQMDDGHVVFVADRAQDLRILVLG